MGHGLTLLTLKLSGNMDDLMITRDGIRPQESDEDRRKRIADDLLIALNELGLPMKRADEVVRKGKQENVK